MGLSEMQRGLAILLTDAAMRERFAADPQSASRTLKMNAEEKAQRVLPAGAEVERFARSLRAKRWNEIQKLLPVSIREAQSVGDPLRRAFLLFAQGYVPQGSKRHAQDALAFARWVGQQPKRTFQNADGTYNIANAAWLPDLIRYEAAWLEMQMRPSRPWLLRRFAYPVPLSARSQSRDSAQCATTGDAFPPQPLWIAWLRLSPHGRLRHYCLSLPVLKWRFRRLDITDAIRYNTREN